MDGTLTTGARRLWSGAKSLRIWHVFIFVRIFSTLWIQPGYIHPDEFYQSVEVVSGDVLGMEVKRTWEFNPEAPIRSIVLPLILYLPCYVVLLIGSQLGLLQLNTYTLLLAPRISIIAVSLLIDHIVYRTLKLCRGLDVDSYMLVYTTSYISLVYHTRTLSNTVESFLFVIMLFYVQREIQRILRFFKAFPRSKLTQCSRTEEPESLGTFEWILPNHIFTMATCIVAGFFNRPTFLLFVYAPYIYYVFDGVLPQTIADFKSAVQMAYRKLWLSFLFCLPAVIVFIHGDTVYYKNFKDIIEMHELPFLEHIHTAVYNLIFKFTFKNILAITPLNFISYNTDSDNLAEHGTHSRFTHIFVNQPMLFGPLTICVLFDALVFIATKYNANLKRTSPLDHSDYKFWFHTYIVPLLLISIFPHQEPRFIIPLLLPIVILYGHLIFGKQSRRFFKISWIILNVCGFIFYGILHQGGVVRSIDYMRKTAISESVETKVHVLYSHTYMPPLHLFLLKNDSGFGKSVDVDSSYRSAPLKFKQFVTHPEYVAHNKMSVHDMYGKPFHEVEEKIGAIYKLHTYTPLVVYVVTPATLEPQLCLDGSLQYTYKFVEQFSGHLSMEDPPNLSYLKIWSDRGFPCSLCAKETPCKLHPFHIFSPVLGLNVYRVYQKY